MTNRLRTEIQDEEEDEKTLIVEEKPRKNFSDNVFMQFLSKGFLTEKEAYKAFPFFAYLGLLGMLYICNTHIAERNIRDIGKIDKQVKELGWDYKITEGNLAYKSTFSQIKSRVDTMGLKESLQPPQKISVREDGQ
jgi:hypothetical protein